MPLKIELKPGEKVVINGAVIEGASDGRTEFVLLNKVSILRQRHILRQEEASTPVKRLYFSLQMLYIEPSSQEIYFPLYEKYQKDLEVTLTLPTLKFALEQIRHCISQNEYYEALKIARAMMETEERLFDLGFQLRQENLPPEIEQTLQNLPENDISAEK